jgi:hypothetical protein
MGYCHPCIIGISTTKTIYQCSTTFLILQYQGSSPNNSRTSVQSLFWVGLLEDCILYLGTMDLERLVNSFDGFTVELMFVTFGLQIRLTSPRLLVIIPSKISPSSAKEAVLLNAPSYIQKKNQRIQPKTWINLQLVLSEAREKTIVQPWNLNHLRATLNYWYHFHLYCMQFHHMFKYSLHTFTYFFRARNSRYFLG